MNMLMDTVIETPYYDCFDFKRASDDKNAYIIRIEVNKSDIGGFLKEPALRELMPKDKRKYRQISPYLSYIHVKKDVYREDGSLLLEAGKVYGNYNKHNNFTELIPYSNPRDYEVTVKTNTRGLSLDVISVEEMKFISDKLDAIYNKY